MRIVAVVRSYTIEGQSSLRLVEASVCEVSGQGGLDVWTMLREIGPGENGFGNEGYDVPFSRFGEYLRGRVDMKRGRNLRQGRVPMTTFWLYDGRKPVAVSKVRHRLNDSLRRVGGHIGYCVRPSERGKGYGTRLLALTLLAARELDLAKVLITCNADNIASRRIVENNGGSLTRTYEGVCYYWVSTDHGIVRAT